MRGQGPILSVCQYRVQPTPVSELLPQGTRSGGPISDSAVLRFKIPNASRKARLTRVATLSGVATLTCCKDNWRNQAVTLKFPAQGKMSVIAIFRQPSGCHSRAYTSGSVKTSADIRIKGDSMEVSFEWRDFDGDDCFNDFRINVTTETGTRRFDFGGCAVSGLRKVSRFFRNETPNTVSGGRNPDIRCYDLYREKDGYRLGVSFEGSGLCEEFYVRNPRTQVDDEFMRTVYSG